MLAPLTNNEVLVAAVGRNANSMHVGEQLYASLQAYICSPGKQLVNTLIEILEEYMTSILVDHSDETMANSSFQRAIPSKFYIFKPDMANNNQPTSRLS